MCNNYFFQLFTGIVVVFLITCCDFQQRIPQPSEQHAVSTDKIAVQSDSSSRQKKPDNRQTVQKNGAVTRNESFYRILTHLGVSPQRIYTLTHQYEKLFDRYELKPGQNYHYKIERTDSTQHLIRFSWEPNLRDSLVFYFDDTLTVERYRRPLITKRKTVGGRIESSLYETFMERDLPIELAYELSDLYAWEIDFFRLREGDSFKVLYEVQYVNGERIGIGNIIAAVFRHRGETFYAYRFYNGDQIGYYDSQGKSLRKALLKAPLNFRYISSGYTDSRYHPILQRRLPHYGIDYVAPRGTPVVSVGDGTVIKAGYDGPNGNMIKIRHNSTYSTTYIHLSDFAPGIEVGEKVKQGEIIGYVGSTGRSTGPHLDYRLYKYGHPVNPRTIELPPTDGIASPYMSAFNYASRKLKQILKQVNTKPLEQQPPPSPVTRKVKSKKQEQKEELLRQDAGKGSGLR